MKWRLSKWVLTAAFLVTTWSGSALAEQPTSLAETVAKSVRVLDSSSIQQYGGDWAGPDLSPYSRDRDKGEIVGRPPATAPATVNKAPVNKAPVTRPVEKTPVSVAPPPKLPTKNVAGGVPVQQLFDNGSLIPVWRGQGRVAGEMLELALTNTTNQPIAIDLDPGMILALEDEELADAFQPVMIETDSVILVPANGTYTKMLRGYCLDYTLDPPAANRTFPYRFPADTVAYAPAIDVLKASLTYDAAESVLPPDKQRTIVIQRSIWAALGQNDKEKLYQDILADAAEAGKTISKKKARRLADSLWNEVERLMKMAQ